MNKNLFITNDIPFHFKQTLNHGNCYSWFDIIKHGGEAYVANAHRTAALRIPNFCESLVGVRV
mgnify:CR=1 FL=1